jgi:hypothetical protein
MANSKHLAMLKKDVNAWSNRREEHIGVFRASPLLALSTDMQTEKVAVQTSVVGCFENSNPVNNPPNMA